MCEVIFMNDLSFIFEKDKNNFRDAAIKYVDLLKTAQQIVD
jgi:hypothetical protein